MENVLIVIVSVGAMLGLAIYVARRMDAVERGLTGADRAEAVAVLRAQIAALQDALQAQLALVQQSVAAQAGDTHSTLGDVRERLGALQQQAQRVTELAQDMASLQDLLRPPKLRGALGELFLERVLEDVVPGRYEVQYEFPSTHTRVDAVVRIGDKLVPIDAKFPLDVFADLTNAAEGELQAKRRAFIAALKRHVDAVARYVVPNDGTVDFAFLYVPAENLYYQLLVVDEGLELRAYCQERRVIPVSPNTLQAYLAAVLLGLRGMAIQENARHLQEMLNQIAQDVARLDADHEKLGRHLDNARSVHDQTARSITRIAERLRQAAAAPLPEQPTQSALPLSDREG